MEAIGAQVKAIATLRKLERNAPAFPDGIVGRIGRFGYGTADMHDFRKLIADGLTKKQSRSVIGSSRTRAFFDVEKSDNEAINFTYWEYKQLSALIGK